MSNFKQLFIEHRLNTLLLEFPHIEQEGKFDFDFRLENQDKSKSKEELYAEFIAKIKKIVDHNKVYDYDQPEHFIKLKDANEVKMFKSNILNNFTILYYLQNLYGVPMDKIKEDITNA